MNFENHFLSFFRNLFREQQNSNARVLGKCFWLGLGLFRLKVWLVNKIHLFFNQKQTYSLKVQVKNEKSFPTLQNLIKNRGRETFSKYASKGYHKRQYKEKKSTFFRGSYNSKKIQAHCFSLCYFNPFGLNVEFHSSW